MGDKGSYMLPEEIAEEVACKLEYGLSRERVVQLRRWTELESVIARKWVIAYGDVADPGLVRAIKDALYTRDLNFICSTY